MTAGRAPAERPPADLLFLVKTHPQVIQRLVEKSPKPESHRCRSTSPMSSPFMSACPSTSASSTRHH